MVEMVERLNTVLLLVWGGGNIDERVKIKSELKHICRTFPLAVTTKCGLVHTIDSIISVNRSGELRMKGLGDKFTCQAIGNGVTKNLTLYKDGDDWYIEK